MTSWELAIDLGTTASAGAVRTGGGRAEVLEIAESRTTPSCVPSMSVATTVGKPGPDARTRTAGRAGVTDGQVVVPDRLLQGIVRAWNSEHAS